MAVKAAASLGVGLGVRVKSREVTDLENASSTEAGVLWEVAKVVMMR
jgi:hypothetical protein